MNEYRQRPHDHLVEPLFGGLDPQVANRPKRRFPWPLVILIVCIAGAWAWWEYF